MASSIKNEIIKNKKPIQNQYKLDPYEHGLLKDMNTALISSIYHRRLLSGFLGYLAKVKMDMPESSKGSAYKYEVDINDPEPILTVTIEKQK